MKYTKVLLRAAMVGCILLMAIAIIMVANKSVIAGTEHLNGVTAADPVNAIIATVVIIIIGIAVYIKRNKMD